MKTRRSMRALVPATLQTLAILAALLAPLAPAKAQAPLLPKPQAGSLGMPGGSTVVQSGGSHLYAFDFMGWLRGALQALLGRLRALWISAGQMAQQVVNFLRSLNFNVFYRRTYDRHCIEFQGNGVKGYCEITERKEFWFHLWR